MAEYNKTWVALVMSILTILEQLFGWSFGVGEEYLTMLFAVLSPILVWVVPNRGS